MPISFRQILIIAFVGVFIYLLSYFEYESIKLSAFQTETNTRDDVIIVDHHSKNGEDGYGTLPYEMMKREMNDDDMTKREMNDDDVGMILPQSYTDNSTTGSTVMTNKLCQRGDIRQGKWMNRWNVTGSIGGGSELAQPDTYRWVPQNAVTHNTMTNANNESTCQYQEDFNSTLFCNLMENAVIMFIGDSILWEQYQSLVYLTGKRVSTLVKIRATFKRGLPVLINVCQDKNVTLMYRWSKQLVGEGTSVSIDEMLREYFPVMIVLNSCAHYQQENSYVENVRYALDLIVAWQQLCTQRNLTSCPFFWKTTAPGIPDCTKFTKPVNSLEEMEAYVETHPMFHWEKFRGQNNIAENLLKEAHEEKGLEYSIIDGYEMGIQRPEFHMSDKDCLHSFHLAAADAENIALLHYLASSRTEKDIVRVREHKYDFPRVTNVKTDGTDIDWTVYNGS